jgi:ferrous iron transport protein A
MPNGKQVTLRQIRAGQSGVVLEIQGGHGLISRLYALGIRPGQRITKVSSTLMRGPVTIKVGNAQVAIGFGMASKIIVAPIEAGDGE